MFMYLHFSFLFSESMGNGMFHHSQRSFMLKATQTFYLLFLYLLTINTSAWFWNCMINIYVYWKCSEPIVIINYCQVYVQSWRLQLSRCFPANCLVDAFPLLINPILWFHEKQLQIMTDEIYNNYRGNMWSYVGSTYSPLRFKNWTS